MAAPSFTLRDASEADAEAIGAIYAHHVLNGLASFEETPPDVSEILRRMKDIWARDLPYLVAEDGGRLQGYAYAGPFRSRPAYRYTAEDSVYLAPGAQGRGIGTALLAEIVTRCQNLGVRRMIAVIGDSGNLGSIALHRKLGFRDAGILPATGFKLGRWVDTVLMERPLGEGNTTLPE